MAQLGILGKAKGLSRVSPLTGVLTGVLTGLASFASAKEVLVTDPVMCAMLERGEYVGETGMVLEPTGMYEIEYTCEFDRTVRFDWSQDATQTVVGYCSEPGVILPGVFVLQMGPFAPGVVEVWTQGSDMPTRFVACQKG